MIVRMYGDAVIMVSECDLLAIKESGQSFLWRPGRKFPAGFIDDTLNQLLCHIEQEFCEGTLIRFGRCAADAHRSIPDVFLRKNI